MKRSIYLLSLIITTLWSCQQIQRNNLLDNRFPFQDSKTGKWGYVNRDGEIIIDPEYDDASHFKERYALVKKNRFRFYINEFNEKVLQPDYGGFSEFGEGLTTYYDPKKERYGFIDKSGEIAISAQYESQPMTIKHGVSHFQDKRGQHIIYGTKISSGYDFIQYPFDKSGVGMAFNEVRSLDRTKKERKYYFIDRNGKVLYRAEHNERLFKFSEGLAIKYIDEDSIFRYEIINSSIETVGKLDTKGWKVEPYSFKEGLLIFKKGNKFGYFNTKGEVQIEANFEDAFAFSEGYAIFVKGEANRARRGFINTEGEVVIPATYYFADNFKNGLALVTTFEERKNEKGKWVDTRCHYYINNKGKKVFEF